MGVVIAHHAIAEGEYVELEFFPDSCYYSPGTECIPELYTYRNLSQDELVSLKALEREVETLYRKAKDLLQRLKANHPDVDAKPLRAVK